MERAKPTIEAMTCGHCVRAATQALQQVEGVHAERVEVGSAVVSYDAAVAAPVRPATAVQDEGYQGVNIGRKP